MLTLTGCAGLQSYGDYQRGIAEMPTHIKTCPSTVDLKAAIKQVEASTTPEQRVELARQLMVKMRSSELKNNRCLQQALAFYNKIRSQRQKAK